MKTRSFSGVAALVLGAVLVTAVPTPARAASVPESESESVSVMDEAHDVRIVRKVKGLSLAKRTSIDLRRVEVEPRDGVVRFTVTLHKVLRTRTFSQMVFFSLAPPPGSADTWSGTIGMSPQWPGLSYAGLDADGTGTDYESCDPLTVQVRHRTDQLRLDVPNRCIPQGEVSIKLISLTGYFRSDAGRPWSQDRLRFPAPVELR